MLCARAWVITFATSSGWVAGPLGDRRVLVQQSGHGPAGFGTPAVEGLLKKLAEFDPRLGLGLGRSSEADRPPAKRVGPGVHGDPVRPARQPFYVPGGFPGHEGIVDRLPQIRSTSRSMKALAGSGNNVVDLGEVFTFELTWACVGW